MTLRVTVLGCGNSTGVPMSNGFWGSCDPAEPRNRRRRSSILIERGGTTVLVDAGPDMREQMLSAGITKLDAVLFTHAHADHTQGIDDLRAFTVYGGAPLPIYAFPEILEQIEDRFHYMFGSGRSGYYDKPFLRSIEAPGRLSIGDVDLTLFEQDHVVCRTIGIRAGDFAYSTDVKSMPEAAFGALAGIKTWLIAAVRREPHIAHAHLDQILEWIARVSPNRAFLTHMNHTMDYRALRESLPPGIAPAFDGLVIADNG
jgi:phosphoribosyl 1,2-cyclic phosphate phosphodiesterase